MSLYARFPKLVIGSVAFVCACIGAWWAYGPKTADGKSQAPTPPAALKKVNEADLGAIRLTEDAEQRLGVRTQPIERKSVGRTRTYGGEAMIPVGRAILVSAPMQGTLRVPKVGLPHAGQAVAKGQSIITLLPLLSPESATTLAASRADIEGQVKNCADPSGGDEIGVGSCAKLVPKRCRQQTRGRRIASSIRRRHA
ncbi:MAG: hypothetical protein QM811_31765 [Pirellulales bacterium]